MIHHPRPVTLRRALWSRWAGLEASHSQWERGRAGGRSVTPKSSANVKWVKHGEERTDDGVSLRLMVASSGLLSVRIYKP